MIDIHPIALNTFIQLFAGIAPPAGIDVCFSQGNFFDRNFPFRTH
jgi:hypothetical protein